MAIQSQNFKITKCKACKVTCIIIIVLQMRLIPKANKIMIGFGNSFLPTTIIIVKKYWNFDNKAI